MGVRNYFSVNGQIRGEHRSGESQTRDYITDALGNVVEVYMGTSIKADAAYTADGDMLSASWNMSSYRFGWVGSWGYRRTGKDWVNTYVRARHYSTSDGAWGTVDPLWPDEAAYRYVINPVLEQDPTGLSSILQSRRISNDLLSYSNLSYLKETRRRVNQLVSSCDREFVIKKGLYDIRMKCDGIFPYCYCLPVPGGSRGGIYPPGSSGVFDIYWYGNYCGSNNVVPEECQGSQGNQPIDCMDRGCQEHDNCIATCESKSKNYWGGCQARCHCMLYAHALYCGSGGCLLDANSGSSLLGYPSAVSNCLQASATVGAAFAGICGITAITGFGGFRG